MEEEKDVKNNSESSTETDVKENAEESSTEETQESKDSSSTEDVKTEESEETEEEEEEASEKKQKQSEYVPYDRFSEVTKENEELRKRVGEIERRIPAEQNDKAIDNFFEEEAKKLGTDEFGAPVVSAKQLRAMAQFTHNMLMSRDSEIIVKSKVDDYIENTNPKALRYKKDILSELNKLSPQARTHPRAIEDCYLKARGAAAEREEAAAERRGKEKGMKEKKIISNVSGEKASGGTLKKGDISSKLTAGQKKIADSYGITHEDYAKSLSSLESQQSRLRK